MGPSSNVVMKAMQAPSNDTLVLEIIDGVSTELAVMALIDQLMGQTQPMTHPEAGMIALQLTDEERNRVLLWAFDKYGPR